MQVFLKNIGKAESGLCSQRQGEKKKVGLSKEGMTTRKREDILNHQGPKGNVFPV